MPSSVCPAGGSTLKCKLPSPMCPYIDSRCGAMRASAGSARAMNSGIREIRTETSCFTDPPFLRLGFRHALPQHHSAARCASDSCDRSVEDGRLRRAPRTGSARASRATRRPRPRTRARAARSARAARRADHARRRRGAARARASGATRTPPNDLVAALAARAAEQPARGGDVLHREPRRRARARLGKQLQHGRRDHAERALRAEEQRLQIVARVVLAQALERPTAPHRSATRPRARARDRASCRSATPPGRRHSSRDCRRAARTLRSPC